MRGRTIRAIYWAALAVSLVALLTFWRLPRETLLFNAISDAGHAPLFGLFALAVLRGLRVTPGLRDRRPLTQYGLALGITVLVAGLAEVHQYFTERDASLWDFFRGVFGGLAVLLTLFALDDGAARALRVGRRVRVGSVILAAGLVLISFAYLADVVQVYLQRRAAFPRICDFDSDWELAFMRLRDIELTFTDAPAGWEKEPGDTVGRLTLLPARYPGLSIVEVEPDWRGYDRLAFEVFSDRGEPLEMILRVSDVHHDNAYRDRLVRNLTIEPGENRISVSLAEIASAPGERAMDMANIHLIKLFAVEPTEPLTVYVDAFRLE